MWCWVIVGACCAAPGPYEPCCVVPAPFRSFQCSFGSLQSLLCGPESFRKLFMHSWVVMQTGSLLLLSILSQFVRRTFGAVLGLYGNLVCSPRSLHDTSVSVPCGSFCVVPGPYENFLCIPEPLKELSLRSLVLTGTFRAIPGPSSLWQFPLLSRVLTKALHVVLGPYRNFLAVHGTCEKFPCGPRILEKISVWSCVLTRTFHAWTMQNNLSSVV